MLASDSDFVLLLMSPAFISLPFMASIGVGGVTAVILMAVEEASGVEACLELFVSLSSEKTNEGCI